MTGTASKKADKLLGVKGDVRARAMVLQEEHQRVEDGEDREKRYDGRQQRYA